MKPTVNPPAEENASAAAAARQSARQRAAAAAEIDASLVQRFKAGDEAAFTAIVHRHYSRTRALAYRILRNLPDAEEVAQDTFIRAHRGLDGFRGDASLAVWLHRIAHNLALNRYWFHFRRRRHATFSLDLPVDDHGELRFIDALADRAAEPRAEAVTREFLELVAEAIRRLDPLHREILLMRTRQNLSYDAMAAALHLNIGTVKSRLARARECLLEELRTQTPELGPRARFADYFEPPRLPAAAGWAPA